MDSPENHLGSMETEVSAHTRAEVHWEPGSGTLRDPGRGTWSDALPPSFPGTSDLGNAVKYQD